MRQTSVRDQRGRGLIGFVAAIVVVGFVGYSLKQIFVVKHRHDELEQFTGDLLADATRRKLDVDTVRGEVLRKGRELGVPMDPNMLQISTDNNGWKLHYEWQDVVALPGYNYTWDFEITHIWKKF